ncbi:MAG: hypothetical protein GY898_06115 [Proteobacteria bacterium]|nr:hypothetical protein [Pseudomonadota bacterium]
MPLGVDRAVAELIRDGDPARSIDGLLALEGFQLYDYADASLAKIWLGYEPETPDELVTVFVEGGLEPIGGGPPNEVGRRPMFSVRTRADDYERSMELSHLVWPILSYYEGTVHGVPFFRILANSEPVPLGRDRDDRTGRFYTSTTYRSTTKRYQLS